MGDQPNSDRRKRRIFLDVVFVLLLPPLCFLFDPIFVEGPEPARVGLYSLVATLIVLFFASYLSVQVAFYSWFIKGSLLLGSIVAFVFAALLLPLTLIGLIFVVGLLGIVPFFTSKRYFERFRLLGGDFPRTRASILAFLLGFAFPFAPAGFLFSQVKNSLEIFYSDITSGGEANDRAAMVRMKSKFFCQSHCAQKIAAMFRDGMIELPEAEFRTYYLSAFGREYDAIDPFD